MCSSHQPIGPQQYPVIFAAANPIRGLLDRKRSKEHLQSSNYENIKQKQKTEIKQKRRKIRKKTHKQMPAKMGCRDAQVTHKIQTDAWRNTKKGTRSREFGIPTVASHPISSPDRNYLVFSPEGIGFTIPYSQGFILLYRHSQCRLGSPWVRPIKAALKRLKLATVTPGATSALFASFASLFLCR